MKLKLAELGTGTSRALKKAKPPLIPPVGWKRLLRRKLNPLVPKRKESPFVVGSGVHPEYVMPQHELDWRLREDDYIYEEIEQTETKRKPDIKLILTKYVEGLGVPGEVVNVRPN